MSKVEKIEFGGHTVVIDPKNLRFDEATLTIYIQHEAGYYDNFGSFLALAEKNQQNKDTLHEKVYYERFVEAKEMGGSDRLAEAKSKSDPTVVALKEEAIQAKYVVSRLKQHLKAWDKSHDNAQSMGHMLRKQVDKLNGEINMRMSNINPGEIKGLDNNIDKTVPDWPTVNNVETETETSSGFETDLSADNLY